MTTFEYFIILLLLHTPSPACFSLLSFQINVDVSRDEVEPDTSVDINFEAKPNSYIGVAGIDQSVLLLKTGNDISHVSQVSMLTTDRPTLTA